MNQPALYHKQHQCIKSDLGLIFKEYSKLIKWRLDGCDTLLDVGSGPGDVLMDYVLPLMPRNFGKIVCSDISSDMIEFAKSYYHGTDRCEFKILDIATKLPLPKELRGQFDHVTSILCLHWVQDYRFLDRIFIKTFWEIIRFSFHFRTALKNIYDLILPDGGDCFFIFIASHTIFDTYNYISRYTKWSEYVKDVHRFISPLHYSRDPKGEFTDLMKEAGFENIVVDLKPTTTNYETAENFKGKFKNMNQNQILLLNRTNFPTKI